VLFALIYLLLRHVVRLIVDSSNDQMNTEVELPVVRHKLMVLKREVGRPQLCRRDRLFMAAISRVLPRARWSSFLVSWQTLLRWHRDLVRRKWTIRRRSAGGRPPIPDEVQRPHPEDGEGEPQVGLHQDPGRARQARHQDLGGQDSHAAARERARSAPRRAGPIWCQFLRSQAQGILAFDLFTVETIILRTMYVLFAIHLGSRHVHVLGVTKNPDSEWVTQQARNLAVGEGLTRIQFLIRDRDSKFSGPFDEVFRSEGIGIVKTPIRAPRANSFAERWVCTVRTECLDWMLVLGWRHLDHMLRVYTRASSLDAPAMRRPESPVFLLLERSSSPDLAADQSEAPPAAAGAGAVRCR
jgi:putative transposase